MFGLGKGKKRCSKGKSCGATCIDRDKDCPMELPQLIKRGLKKVVNAIRPERNAPPPATAPRSGGRDPETIDAKGTILTALLSVDGDPNPRVIDGSLRGKGLNWDAATGSGVNFVGGGEFGAFVTVPPDKLSPNIGNRFPDGVGVKGGQIGIQEAEALRIAGRKGIGPELIGGVTTSKSEIDSYGISSYRGVLAMSKVPGVRFVDASDVVNGVSKDDIYWSALGKLHRLGIAHNDTHAGNLIIDSKGGAKFVDFGLAQVNPKAALAEALGSFYGGNWQFAAEYSGKEAIARKNLKVVGRLMGKAGLSKDDLIEIMGTEIRQTDDFFTKGAWGKLSNRDAMKMIEAIYKGI